MSHFWDLPQAATALFPRHGWVEGSAGVLQLRLPILRLYQFQTPHHMRYVQLGLAGMWLQSHSPHPSVRLLAVALRDLAFEFGHILKALNEGWLDKDPSEERNQVLTRHQEAVQRSEVLLTAALVILRRLADQVIDATRPLLFDHWQSAPRQMKTAISAANAGKLVDLKPRCKVDELTSALLSKTKWFEDLRQEAGIRDVLIHKDHWFSVSSVGIGDGAPSKNVTWRVTADLWRMKRDGGRWHVDVVPALRACLAGMCDFMEALYSCLVRGGEYAQGDMVFLTGRDEDVVAFWPPLDRPLLTPD